MSHRDEPISSHLAWKLILLAVERGTDVHVEVGIDAGQSLTRFKRSYVNSLFIGLEIKPDKALLATRRVSVDQVDNVYVVCSGAHEFFEHAPSKELIDTVHVYFPTPDQRLLNVASPPSTPRLITLEFLGLVRRTLRLGGSIRVVTDVLDYRSSVEGVIDLNYWWPRNWIHHDTGQVPGTFVGTPCEIKYRSFGRSIYAFVLQRVQ